MDGNEAYAFVKNRMNYLSAEQAEIDIKIKKIKQDIDDYKGARKKLETVRTLITQINKLNNKSDAFLQAGKGHGFIKKLVALEKQHINGKKYTDVMNNTARMNDEISQDIKTKERELEGLVAIRNRIINDLNSCYREEEALEIALRENNG